MINQIIKKIIYWILIKKKKRKLTLKGYIKLMIANLLIKTWKSVRRTIIYKCFWIWKMGLILSLKIRCSANRLTSRNINCFKFKLIIWDSYLNLPTVSILKLIWMLYFNQRILIKLSILYWNNQRNLMKLSMLTNKNEDSKYYNFMIS